MTLHGKYAIEYTIENKELLDKSVRRKVIESESICIRAVKKIFWI